MLELAEQVTPAENSPVTEVREDDKFLAAALASGADAVITNDQHLLAVHPSVPGHRDRAACAILATVLPTLSASPHFG